MFKKEPVAESTTKMASELPIFEISALSSPMLMLNTRDSIGVFHQKILYLLNFCLRSHNNFQKKICVLFQSIELFLYVRYPYGIIKYNLILV